jgi:hypothetical protein
MQSLIRCTHTCVVPDVCLHTPIEKCGRHVLGVKAYHGEDGGQAALDDKVTLHSYTLFTQV